MMLEEMKEKLQKVLPQKRFVHSVNVMQTACELAKIYGADENKARHAGLLHDCARHLGDKETLEFCKKYGIEVDDILFLQPDLLHGPVGAFIAKEEYGVIDEEVLSAINCHTTGKENMSLLDKIVLIADYIEPGRSFPGVDKVRDLAVKDLNRAVVVSLEQVIVHVISKGVLVYKDTINARNYIPME